MSVYASPACALNLILFYIYALILTLTVLEDCLVTGCLEFE